MTRFQYAVALLVAALAGCARPTPMPDAFPETLGEWHRVGPVRDIRERQNEIPVRTVEATRAATYEGPGRLDVRVYALATPAVALDVAQRWTPRPGMVFFYSDRFLVVVQWQRAGKKELQGFLSDLEKRFQATDQLNDILPINNALPKLPFTTTFIRCARTACQ
jgi:hypothetical protein